MNLYREQGVVLRTWKLGEADRIVVLLTQGEGKVRAVAKGVRKTKSRFGGRLEPFSHVDLSLYRGRELDIVTQAEVINPFRALREDYDRVVAGAAMLEAVDQVAQERGRHPALSAGPGPAGPRRRARDPSVVLDAFLLKLMALEGYRPAVAECASCGAADRRRAASPSPAAAAASAAAAARSRLRTRPPCRCWPPCSATTWTAPPPPTRPRPPGARPAPWSRGTSSTTWTVACGRIRWWPLMPSALPPDLDPKTVPDHVAIVMDGNGRWAGAKGLPRNKGHEAGEALFDTVEGAWTPACPG